MKKKYETPSLEKFGAVSQLTASGSGGAAEDGNNNDMNPGPLRP